MTALAVNKKNYVKCERNQYLQQHANYLMDWYLWCEEALDNAKKKSQQR